MLDNLTQRLAKVVKTMRGEARLTESNTAEMLREVRMALLEADVALPAVRELIARVKEKALGEEVISSLTPGQALVGVVQKELASLMGASQSVLAEKDGTGHAPNFARVQLPRDTVPGTIVTITPTRVIEGLLA